MSHVSALIFLLAALSTAGLLYTFFAPRFAHEARVKRRLRTAVASPIGTSRRGAAAGKFRKRTVEETLRDLELKQKEKARASSRPSLGERLRQSGLGWSRMTYFIVCLSVGVASCLFLAFVFGINVVAVSALGSLAGLLLPRRYVASKRNRRFAAFTAELPNAVDVIVRGVRSGLPLADCLRVIAAEGQEPVRGEFKIVVDDQTLGVPVQDAMLRLGERVPLPETNFLATVVAVQSKSGGNLTEALANLSNVLRERRKMRSKIKALSAEAKASAAIIGSMPPAVSGMLYLTSPQYISLLFNTTLGQIVLAVCAIWMSIGVMVMSAMINFDF